MSLYLVCRIEGEPTPEDREDWHFLAAVPIHPHPKGLTGQAAFDHVDASYREAVERLGVELREELDRLGVRHIPGDLGMGPN